MAFLTALGPLAFSQQNKESLKEEKARLEKEIALTSRLLEEVKQNKVSSIESLVLINRKIDQREKLIDNISQEIQYLNNQIVANQKRISQLERKLEILRKEYARLIRAAARNSHHLSRLMYIFSSEDFSQAMKRLNYLKQYGDHRREQTNLIQRTQDSIKNKNERLRMMRTKEITLRSQQELEKRNLIDEKVSKNEVVKKLSSQEEKLLASIRQKQRTAKKLEKAIENIIAEEIARSREASALAAKDKPVIKRTFELTPEQAALSDNFHNNRGKLPWPSRKGVISSTYGAHTHPVLKYVKVNNNGIDILVPKGSRARAVFDGRVTNIITIPGQNWVVIIRHGEYLTVYANLVDVKVRVGQEVITTQEIGTVFTDIEANKTELHFEIWKGKIRQNPSYWLSS
jgi:septal ring factor EnvC (AmiA/AmiB activator)